MVSPDPNGCPLPGPNDPGKALPPLKPDGLPNVEVVLPNAAEDPKTGAPPKAGLPKAGAPPNTVDEFPNAVGEPNVPNTI